MITHSCPCGIGIGMRGSNTICDPGTDWADELGLGVIPQDDCGEPGLTQLWNGLAVKPHHWLFGHFHVIHQRTMGHTTFTCTGTADRAAVSPIVLDTQTMQLTIGSTWHLGE